MFRKKVLKLNKNRELRHELTLSLQKKTLNFLKFKSLLFMTGDSHTVVENSRFEILFK
jgi:predicted NUDIX family phosphoesterase